MTTETKEAKYLVLKVSEIEAGVVKLVRGEQGPVVEARYRIKDGVCDCTGYEFRKTCKHLEMVANITHGPFAPHTIPIARDTVSWLLKEFGPGSKPAEELYERDPQSGLVVGVKILAPGPGRRTYFGVLNGLKITVEVFLGDR